MRSAGQLELDVRVLELPAGKDPDEFIRASAAEWPGLVEKARPLVDYVIDIGTRNLPPDSTIQERERVARQLLPLLTATENNLHQRQNVQRLAIRLRIPEPELLQWAGAYRRDQAPRRSATHQAAAAPHANGRPSGPARERYCLATLLKQSHWLFEANRLLRELAATDDAAAPLLAPLQNQDFGREDHRFLFGLIETASFDGAPDILSTIEKEAPDEIMDLVEEIYPEGHLEAFRHRVSALHATELASIMQDHGRGNDPRHRSQEEFLKTIVSLRLERLKRERTERYFFVNLGGHLPDEAGSEPEEDQAQMRMYTRAQRILEQALRDLNHRRQNL